MRLISQLLSTMAAVAVAAWIFDGIWFDGVSAPFSEQLVDKFIPVTVVAVIMWLVATVVTPVVKFLSFPLVVLTLGLFLWVVNALMLMLVAQIADSIGVGFHVDGFWVALGGALVITVVERVVAGVLSDD